MERTDLRSDRTSRRRVGSPLTPEAAERADARHLVLIDRAREAKKKARKVAQPASRCRLVPEGIVGRDAAVVAIFEQLDRLRVADLPPGERPSILLTGETGTGKGLVARALHQLLGTGPYVDFNCTTAPPSLIEGELFGHERGSFTDARTSRAGLFEAADGGTIFLDEIGELDLGMQAKFLSVVEEKRVRRLGSTCEREVNAHVVVATNRDLTADVKAGRFRLDLFHRLSVLSFEIPPLRARSADIPELAAHFCCVFGRKYGGYPRRLSSAAVARLVGYPWPGNVRELRNVIERAILLHPEEEIGAESLEGLLKPAAEQNGDSLLRLPEKGIDLAELERELLTQALERARGNRKRAAALLGLSRDTLRYRIEKWGIA